MSHSGDDRKCFLSSGPCQLQYGVIVYIQVNHNMILLCLSRSGIQGCNFWQWLSAHQLHNTSKKCTDQCISRQHIAQIQTQIKYKYRYKYRYKHLKEMQSPCCTVEDQCTSRQHITNILIDISFSMSMIIINYVIGKSAVPWYTFSFDGFLCTSILSFSSNSFHKFAVNEQDRKVK